VKLPIIVRRGNKYHARRTEYNGRTYDSIFEANTAASLDMLKHTNLVLKWEPQYEVKMDIYASSGRRAFGVKHKVDFLVSMADGTYLLLETKGVATTDWKWRKKFLETVWLPDNPNYKYKVIYKGDSIL
jgi:Protein of unknown function (DUF1064)